MEKARWIRIALVVGVIWPGLTALAVGGSYRDSAHGNALYGVNRSAIDSKFAEYATGNCAHCHEMHGSLQGAEPAPTGGPSPHALFFNNFNAARTQKPYMESDNFCFFCHSSDSGQRVTNQDYSATFGGAAGSGPQSILDAFNQPSYQGSYHNLYDIWNFLRDNESYPWFTSASNPCSACHNPHLAKRNWDPAFPLRSAISRPGDHANLWGETELMSSHDSYEAPYADDYHTVREPAGVVETDGSKTPDYVGFCTACHNVGNTAIWSTDLNRNLQIINWGPTGDRADKHGAYARDGADHLLAPYGDAGELNFVLSCLDCHESHGSPNIMLLRRRINGGGNMEGTVVAAEPVSYGYACARCHKDDLAAAAGTGQANSWEYVHHGAAGAPYIKNNCLDCHGSGEPVQPIACGNCHGHGMDDSWAAGRKSGRKTF